MSMFGRLLAAVSTAMIFVAPGAYAAAAANGAATGGASAAAPASKETHPGAAQPANNDDLFYALGVLMSRSQNIASLDLSDQELKQLLNGFRDGYQHRAQIDDPQPYLPRLQALQHSREQAMAGRQKQAGAAFVAKVAALPGAQKTTTGLVYVPSTQGSGAQPKPTDRVKVQYSGKLIDGSVFDSSYKRGEPATFPLGGIIPCWKEALQLMKVGGKARIVCPSDLAYGDQGRLPIIPPGATLDFQIELLDVLPPAAPPMPSALPGATAPRPGASGAGSPPPR